MDAAVTVQPALGRPDGIPEGISAESNAKQFDGQVVAAGARKTETPRLWNRSVRVYCEPGRCDAWFFQTREGVDVGPYVSQFAAEVEASLLKEQLAQEDCQQARMARIDSFLQESLELEIALS